MLQQDGFNHLTFVFWWDRNRGCMADMASKDDMEKLDKELRKHGLPSRSVVPVITDPPVFNPSLQ